MNCSHCGAPVGGQETFCSNCGAPLPRPAQPMGGPAPAGPTPAGARLFSVICDSLFLALCILLTVAGGLAVISGSIPLLTVLAVIFLWLLYSASKRGQLAVPQFKYLSGTATAAYVLSWVALVALILSFFLLLLSSSVLKSAGVSLDDLWSRIADALNGQIPPALIALFSRSLVWIILTVIIVGVVAAVISLLATRTLRLFLRSVAQSAESGVPAFTKSKQARVWLIVLAVGSGIAAVSSLSSGAVVSALSNGSMCAALIIGSMLIKKYFPEED